MKNNKDDKGYFCNKCSRMHYTGKIFEEHAEYARASEELNDQRNILHKAYPLVSEEVQVPQNALIFRDFDRLSLLDKINDLIRIVYNQISNGKIPKLEIPLRRRENIVYNEQGNLFLGTKTRTIEFGDKYSELVKLTRIAVFVKELLETDIYATKREMFYNDVPLFKNQRYSDRIIEDLAVKLGTFRDNLHVVASPKGSCIGRLKLKDQNDIIDLEKLGTGGWTIPTFLKNIEILESDANFVLVLEKDAAMLRLSEAKFYHKIPCILLTSQGFPNYSARLFLKKITNELKIPVFGLADADPHGLSILMAYTYGTIQSAHETSRLATNNFYWLGVTSSDIEDYDIPERNRIKMTKAEMRKVQEMLDDEFLKKHPKLKGELKHMQTFGQKTEIQSFTLRGFQFFMDYITSKIDTGELIKF